MATQPPDDRFKSVEPWPSSIRRIARLERVLDAKAALDETVPPHALVSVIMTTFNSSPHVAAAIQSILNQTHAELELVIVDDASTDETVDCLRAWQQADARIRLVFMQRNRGTYWAKNIGLTVARGDVITFMDSDDVAADTRLSEQLMRLRAPATVATLCNYVRVDEAGNPILNRGLMERLAPISLMAKARIFSDIGFFDSVRTSADSEFIDRLKLAYGRRGIGLVEKPLYRAILRPHSLSSQPGNRVALSGNAVGHLSPARAHYAFCYGKWHAEVARAGHTPCLPFPLTYRPFAVHGRMAVQEGRFADEPVVAFMASFPPRRENMKKAVASLMAQVDRLYIYLNGYDEVPEFLHDDRIVALPAGQADLKDVGKLFHQRLVPTAYAFTVDDDIEYPPDYCQRMMRTVEKYDRRALVGVHGVIFEQPVTRYFSANRQVFHFRQPLEADTPVNLLGTGTLCFHTSTLTLDHTAMPVGMLDIGVAIAARQAGIPMVAVARQAQWLKPLKPDETGTTLYDVFRENDAEHTSWLARQADWTILSV